MLFGKSKPVVAKGRRGAIRPGTERLESRTLLAIDLATITGTVGSTNGLGVLNSGLQASGGAGFSTAEVGDVNGDGFDDYVIGAPTVAFTGANGIDLGSGSNARVFLVFGSRQVNSSNAANFLNLTDQQRTGDLGQLGNVSQTNPVNGSPGFDYDGLTFFASQNANSQLGASVAAVGDVNGDGFADFMIGAPGGNDANNVNDGAGRAFLIYGSANLVRANKQVDLDSAGSNTDLNILTFVTAQANANLGRSVGLAGDVITDGRPDVAIGAPGTTVNGLTSSGAVYLVSGVQGNNGVLRPARTQTVLVDDIGTTTGIAGLLLGGANAGDRAGFSVAGVGNVNGDSNTGGQGQDDLLIGALNANGGTGAAYLLYGSTTLLNLATLTNNNIPFISLARLANNSATNNVPGAIFLGSNIGDETGFSVASAGDFSDDALGDFMIGSPGFNLASGRVSLIFGNSTAGALTGVFDLSALGSGVQSVTFTGSGVRALAGFSESLTGDINGDGINEIIIGSPGFINNSGAAYLIPGNPDLFGTLSLSNTEADPIDGILFTNSVPTTPNLLGTGVSGRLFFNSQGRQVDSDGVADFVIGSAGYTLGQGRTLAGAGFLLEGARIPLPIPVSSAIQATIGVDAPPPGPFRVNASTPATLQIFVLSDATITPNFLPVTDINPATIVVNGVAFPGATIAADPVDENGDGLPDAIITITPRTALGLTNASTLLTITGRTLDSSPNANRRFTGSATIIVTGGGGGGGGGGLPGTNFIGFAGFNAPSFPPAYGERLIPSLPVVGKNSHYKPIPQAVAYQSFLPKPEFRRRNHAVFHGSPSQKLGSGRRSDGYRTTTLSESVFTRGRFPKGVHFGKVKHKGRVI